jgi:hypothetical protein
MVSGPIRHTYIYIYIYIIPNKNQKNQNIQNKKGEGLTDHEIKVREGSALPLDHFFFLKLSSIRPIR